MTSFDVQTLSGATVVDPSGEKIGTVSEVYLDDTSGQPEWVTVKTGLFGTKHSFVPLAASRLEGGQLVVEADKDKVTGAPRVDGDDHISEQEEAEIYSYYGISGSGQGYSDTVSTGTTGTTGTSGTETVTGTTDRTAGYERSAGQDTSGPNTDDAMTRSEEHLVAGTQQTEAGKARLRKYVVTDTESVQVPVSHEEVRLEREPITDANRDAAYSGGDITEEEHEVTLHAERPVVGTETEAVERVRLGKETVTDTETVSGEVRKEQIEFDDPTGTSRNN
jgi:uncharacterized protein (TIGR02271 family)